MAHRNQKHVRQLIMGGIVLATINAKWIHPSLALRLLKANLGSLEDRAEILEFALRQPLGEKVEPILAARPRILGLSVSIWNHKATVELLEALNKIWGPGGEVPEKPVVVLGGPEVSWLPEDSGIFRYADYVIRGEGEESFRSLCAEILGENPGTAGKSAGASPAVFINSGDTLVDPRALVPAYRLYTGEDLQKKLVYVEASRGCPFGCEFCLSSAGSPAFAKRDGAVSLPKLREFPLEPFLAEMGILAERGAKTFKFLDRSFNLDAGRAKRIMEFFLERIEARGKERPLCVHFEMVPSRISPELKDLIRRFPPGSLRLELGIQTFNAETSALIHRASRPGEELEILEFLRRETNAIVHADLIAGLPGEGFASFGAGFDLLWKALSANPAAGSGTNAALSSRVEIQLGILKLLPGTPIARRSDSHGMRYSAEPPYEVLETAALSAAELGRIKNFARFWELIVNRNPFPDLLPRLFPPGEPVFEKFMIFSDELLRRFGRNWGLDKKELLACCMEFLKEKT